MSQSLDHARAMVREAFSCELGAGLYGTSPLADMFTRRSRDIIKPTKRFKKLTATEYKTLSPIERQEYLDAIAKAKSGIIAEPTARASAKKRCATPRHPNYSGGYSWLIRNINAAPPLYQHLLKHFYKPNSGLYHLEWLLLRLWELFQPSLKGKHNSTRVVAFRALKVQLTAVNDPIKMVAIKHQPWLFLELPYDTWGEAYKKIWKDVEKFIAVQEEKALDEVVN